MVWVRHSQGGLGASCSLLPTGGRLPKATGGVLVGPSLTVIDSCLSSPVLICSLVINVIIMRIHNDLPCMIRTMSGVH